MREAATIKPEPPSTAEPSTASRNSRRGRRHRGEHDWAIVAQAPAPQLGRSG
jgi:hypothetical protein